MNIGVATLLGYAIKEIVAPIILDGMDVEKEPPVESSEVDKAISASEDTLRAVTSIVDIFV
ncbi:hypothetical protein ABT56_10155 [Photobacterium aquae]|uniref:Uncharacterized protein n=1 Tax=Photobacterium aquae TaxID=1195763 RepID=A0A0J1H253_9GAMM|nr:hypothetical protein [Photobacterium aquae]KLV05885.1 hypothetical protein ABT56_10155 [Photobacterium aquae]